MENLNAPEENLGQQPGVTSAVDSGSHTGYENTQPSEKSYSHVVTEEDLANNPDLVQQGIKAGDTIEIPEKSAPAPKEKEASGSESEVPTPVKKADKGRFVQYFLPSAEIRHNGNHEFLPALVVASGEDNVLNLRVFTDGEAILYRQGVAHKSATSNPAVGYWDWPVIR